MAHGGMNSKIFEKLIMTRALNRVLDLFLLLFSFSFLLFSQLRSSMMCCCCYCCIGCFFLSGIAVCSLLFFDSATKSHIYIPNMYTNTQKRVHWHLFMASTHTRCIYKILYYICCRVNKRYILYNRKNEVKTSAL